ncbi:MAG: tRNA-dihydrouridine synthase [Methanobrevibacter sp.]|jgi:TIM-barrel protein|nr:tRNA-dihydrouridine synthase [Candidatus Methanoflexus mossambicus]
MAGISDSNFINKMIPYGFNMVTLGGYNTDKETIEAGKEIIKRGRKEFDVSEEDIYNHINSQVNNIKEFNGNNNCNENQNIFISANLRAITPEPIIGISKIKNLDVVEINCHCRQEEIVNLNCGQGMLNDMDYLNDYISQVVKKSKSYVSVKIRANIDGIDTIAISKMIDDVGADFLHIDLMKPGVGQPDLELLKAIRNETNIFIIGNNMIQNVESANKMIAFGADGFSIARGTLNGKLNFNLNQIKTKTFNKDI